MDRCGPLLRIQGAKIARGASQSAPFVRSHVADRIDTVIEMAAVDLNARIPNNVGLAGDSEARRALEHWQPRYLDWWHDMGPEGAEEHEVYLRAAVDVGARGWANFGYIKMQDYRWGIFLSPRGKEPTVGFGDDEGSPAWSAAPSEHRAALRRIITALADTEPAGVEQQRRLGRMAPSLYDLRNLYQVNVDAGRHLWAMVYLLQKYFGTEGRDEADALLMRRSGDEQRPRIFGTFNRPCDHWLSFFASTTFADRHGKYQLAALRESGFLPLARSCDYMLNEEAFHLFVGETGMERIIVRAAELERLDPSGDVRGQGGVDLDTVQRAINYWFSTCLDLFGAEVCSDAASDFAAGLKGRFREPLYEEHRALEDSYPMVVARDGRLTTFEVPLRHAVNEILRDDYIKDCQRVVAGWNRRLEQHGSPRRLTLPSRRFHRHQGIHADQAFDPAGQPISSEQFARARDGWLLGEADNAYLRELMQPVTAPGRVARWIAPPRKGIGVQGRDFEYVRM